METVPAQTVSLTGQVMLYRQPELLSREVHGELGMNASPTRFGFAAKAHICPLTVPEFAAAGLSFPVIFVGEQMSPVAVLGLQEGQNLFMDENGYLPDVYVPCYIRRYPFVLAGGDGDDRMLVAIDRAYEGISKDAQYPFFEKNGEPTEYTQNSIKFCNDFETQNRMTASFIALLKELDLFENRETTYRPQAADGTEGEPQTLAQYWGVSEAKLNALPAAKLAELRDNGALQQIYAHLNSLLGWERLLIRASALAAAQTPVAANA
jgi:hypothetical protein